jgi:hypothetical protein
MTLGLWLALSGIWIGVARAKDWIPPQFEPLFCVKLAAVVGGLYVAWFQFLRDRRRGMFAYATHRGTGVEGLFAARVLAGLLAVALLAIGPPLASALWIRSYGPDYTVIPWNVLGRMALLSSCGASAYAIGVLATQLRRRPLVNYALGAVAVGGAVLGSTVLTLTSASEVGGLAKFFAIHVVVAVAAGWIARSLLHRSADRDLPLPVKPHVASLLFAVATTLPVAWLLLAFAQEIAEAGLTDRWATIFREKSSGELLAGERDDDGIMHRLDTGEVLENERFQVVRMLDRVEVTERDSPLEVVFRPTDGVWSTNQSNDFEFQVVAPDDFPQGWHLLHAFRGQQAFVANGEAFSIQVFFDAEKGVVRQFSFVSRSPRLEERIPLVSKQLPDALPFARSIGKPTNGLPFSKLTTVIDAPGMHYVSRTSGPSRYMSTFAPACLVDQSDGTLWTLDPSDLHNPLRSAELPNGDRFLQLERVFGSPTLRFGRYIAKSHLVRGERGLYEWSDAGFVTYEPGATDVLEAQAEDHVEVRIVETQRDALARTIEFRDAKDDHLLFAHRYSPRTAEQRAHAACAYAIALLRPPAMNLALGFSPRRAAPTRMFPGTLLEGRSRVPLLAGSVVIALISAALAWRRLDARGASPALCTTATAMCLFLGPFALALVWALEPRRRARRVVGESTVAVPALLIESVPT